MKRDSNTTEDSGMLSALRDAVASGDPTDTARLKTVANLCAEAALRVADDEHGSVVDEASSPEAASDLTTPHAMLTAASVEESAFSP